MQITDIEIRTAAEAEGLRGSLEVVMHSDVQAGGFVCAQLLSGEGREEDRIFPVPLEKEIDFCMQVPSVRLWDMERVCLYSLVLELRDEQMQLLGCTVKKIAFRRAKDTPEGLVLNGRNIRLRPKRCTEEEIRRVMEMQPDDVEKKLREWLAVVKREHYNVLSISRENPEALYEEQKKEFAVLAELCLEYGLYYTEKASDGSAAEEVPGESQEMSCGGLRSGEEITGQGENPDFELNVTQQGVLIENHCMFVNVSEYDLRYTLLGKDKIICEGTLCADVPPESGRYIELPFDGLTEAGEYTYRVSLHLKQDTVWAERGYEIASGESIISNLFSAG